MLDKTALLFPMVASMALKSAVVFASARLLAYLLRGRSAAARHLVWTAAAAAVLALPFLSLSLPALRVVAPVAVGSLDTGLVFQALGIARVEAAPQPTTAPVAGPAKGASTRPGLRFWLVSAWAVGVLAAFAQMLVAYFALWRLRRASRPFHDGGLTSTLAQAMGLDHPVPVWETTPGSMPMTFGFLRPSVLMPADSARWSDDRRRIVLLHELAHVRRGDPATHLVARTAFSLNWWNPLAWIAWREFLKERERAADDLVLTAGARASEYAGHLLGVAREMHSAPASPCAAVAMARCSQLEDRLAAILDARVNRKPSGRAAPVLAVIAAIVLVAPFAAVRAQEAKPAVPPELDATIIAANSQKNHEILDRAAAAYANLMKYDVAQTLLEKALDIRAQTSGEQSSAYAVGLVKLGDLAARRGQSAEAYAFYSKAVALGDRPEVAPALVYMGIYTYGKRDYPAAANLLQRALAVSPNGPQAGAALTWLAELQQQEGAPTVNFRADTVLSRDPGAKDPALSEELYRKAMATQTPDSFDAATTMELYARFLRQHDRAGEAEPLESRASQIRNARIAELSTGPSAATVLKVGSGVAAPAVIFKKDPAYSPEARAAKYQGTVLLFVEIGPDGLAHNIQVKRGLGLGLDEQAVLAVSQWRFRPGAKDGQPVTVAATIEVNFRLM